jgi:tRNA-Thr(GGU) m(6)t(6)A37 methyltransferase TsaA
MKKDSIEIVPIGFVSKTSDNDKDKSISKIVVKKEFAKALDGIEDFSHIHIIYWLHNVTSKRPLTLTFENIPVGVFATRTPVHPNPLGLTLVELKTRKENVLWVKGLDADDGTPVLDIKPYPDWARKLTVVTDFRVPQWYST